MKHVFARCFRKETSLAHIVLISRSNPIPWNVILSNIVSDFKCGICMKIPSSSFWFPYRATKTLQEMVCFNILPHFFLVVFCRKEKNKTSFSFCLEGDWCRGVKVDRTGKGLLQVWKRQIQQLNRVSLEMANAIVAQYPSPLLLMQARLYISIRRYIQCVHANSYPASKRNLKSHAEILKWCKKKKTVSHRKPRFWR